MNFFKYLFLLLIFISFDLHAYCEHPANSYGTTRLNPMPPTACYPELNGSGFCKFKVEQASPYMDSSDSNLAPYAAFTLSSISDQVYKNSDCTNPPLQEGCVQLSNGNIECEEEEEEEEENDPVLQCSTDSCPNPENKRCPTGYTRGSFNGQNLCVKSRTEEECNDPNGCDESQAEIIAAIDRANNDITDSTYSISDTFNEGFENITNALNAILDKIAELTDAVSGMGNNNGGSENTNQPPDTSQFNADLPVEDVEINQNLDTGLYTSNTQCPAKKIINIPQYGLHFEFDFSEICNTLQMFGYLVLIFAYVVAARIVIKS